MFGLGSMAIAIATEGSGFLMVRKLMGLQNVPTIMGKDGGNSGNNNNFPRNLWASWLFKFWGLVALVDVTFLDKGGRF